MQGGSPTYFGVLNCISEALDADHDYLRLHYNKMQANWHYYIECTSMRVGMLNIT